MFDLKKQERSILVFLLAALLIGLSIVAYQKSKRSPEVRIVRFDPGDRGIAVHRKIDINIADPEELGSLEGIGAVMAGRIVAHRSEHGAFASIEEIKNVKGIGQSLFDKIKDDITVGE